MRKIFTLALVFILVFSFLLIPLEKVSAEGIVGARFVNPKDITVFDDALYVLDDIGNGTTVIHKFDLQGTQRTAYTAQGNFFNFYIMEASGQTRVYLLNESAVFYADLAGASTLTLTKCIDVNNEYSIKDSGLALYKREDGVVCAYFALSQGNADLIYQVNLSNSSDNVQYPLSALIANQIVILNGYIYLSTNQSVLKYEINPSNASLRPPQTHYEQGAEIIVAEMWERANNFLEHDVKFVGEGGVNIECVKIASYFDEEENDKIYYFALKEDNKIYKYFTLSASQPQSRQYVKIDSFSLGTDTITALPPADIVGWEIVVCGGYPSNYIYRFKTAENGEIHADSVTQGVNLTEGEMLIKLKTATEITDYDYVFYNGKYGFTEKGSLQDVTQDFNYSSQQKTINPISWVYFLPYASGENFSIKKDTVVNIEKMLEIWGKKWYYASFETERGTESGWIWQSEVTDKSSGQGQNALEQPTYIINPPVGKKVAVFSDEAGQQALTVKGEEVFLGLGKRVTVLNYGEEYCKIYFTYEGFTYRGYLKTQYLIEGGLTTTAVLALALLSVVAVATVFLIIMAKRKKVHDKAQEAKEESNLI